MLHRSFLLTLIFVIATSISNAQALLPYVEGGFFNNNGAILSGGKICTSVTGTSTNLATYPTYTDAVNLTNPNPNPVVLDSSGRANIWLKAGSLYRISIYASGTGNTCNGSAVGALIKTVDGVSSVLTSVSGDLLPSVSNTYSLGSHTYEWKNLYAGGFIQLDGMTVLPNAPPTTTVNIYVTGGYPRIQNPTSGSVLDFEVMVPSRQVTGRLSSSAGAGGTMQLVSLAASGSSNGAIAVGGSSGATISTVSSGVIGNQYSFGFNEASGVSAVTGNYIFDFTDTAALFSNAPIQLGGLSVLPAGVPTTNAQIYVTNGIPRLESGFGSSSLDFSLNDGANAHRVAGRLTNSYSQTTGGNSNYCAFSTTVGNCGVTLALASNTGATISTNSTGAGSAGTGTTYTLGKSSFTMADGSSNSLFVLGASGTTATMDMYSGNAIKGTFSAGASGVTLTYPSGAAIQVQSAAFVLANSAATNIFIANNTSSATATNVYLLNNGTLTNVLIGAADSCTAGYRCLRIAN